jgi:hypothetical protein
MYQIVIEVKRRSGSWSTDVRTDTGEMGSQVTSKAQAHAELEKLLVMMEVPE